MLSIVQIIKLGIILSDPQSAEFKYWFYQCFQYPPYSFNCHTVHGDLFPMAYSLFWYAIYVPLTSHGYWTFSFTMLAVDTVTGLLITTKRSQLGFAIWAQGSLYFLLASPQDFLVWTLILASWTRIGPIASTLAVLTKLPLLPPIFDTVIWNYILYNPYSVHDPMNWARYTLIGSYWLFFLSLWLRNRKLLHQHINSLYIDGRKESAHANTRHPIGTASSCHWLGARQYSRHFYNFRVYSTRFLQWSPVARHHRTLDFRSYNPVRGCQTHQWRQRQSSLRHEEPTPKPSAKTNPKALNPLKTLRRLAVPSGLFLLLLLATIPYAHASTYVGYNASNLGGNTCGTNCSGPNDTTHGIGQTIKAPFTGQLTAIGVYVGSGAPTQLVIGTYAGTPTSTTISCGAAGTDAGINSGQSFTVQDVEALSGMTGQAFNTINLANPVSVTANQYVAIIFMGGASTELMLLGAGASTAFLDTLNNFATSNPTVGNSYSTASSSGSCGPIVGGSFTPSGGTNTVVAQCYGNCGNPAVTLANTNTTHTVNFNSSITIFYQFQSNLNGFVKNITAPVAKNYNGQRPIRIGLYSVDPTCTASAQPFTSQCPGFLANTLYMSNPPKGNMVLITNIPAANGQWFGVALTATFAAIDINDTNTSVAMFQTSGVMPSPITSSSNIGVKTVGLYAWVTGTIITVAPPNGVPSGCNTVTCGLLGFWGALGDDLPAGIVVFIVIVGFVLAFFAILLVKLGGPVGIFTIMLPLTIISSVIVMAMLSAIGILPIYLPILIIIISAWLFSVKVFWHRGSGGDQA